MLYHRPDGKAPPRRMRTGPPEVKEGRAPADGAKGKTSAVYAGKGESYVVKGVSRRVVVVRSPEGDIGDIFEQAIFILKENAYSRGGKSPADILREACRIAESSARGRERPRRFYRLPAPVFAALGALAVAAAWLVSALL